MAIQDNSTEGVRQGSVGLSSKGWQDLVSCIHDKELTTDLSSLESCFREWQNVELISRTMWEHQAPAFPPARRGGMRRAGCRMAWPLERGEKQEGNVEAGLKGQKQSVGRRHWF